MRAAAVVLLLAVASPRYLSGQTYGDVVGRVRESWGRGVGLGGARVDVVGTPLWTITDYKGRYRIHAVPVGRHAVNVQAAGYAPARHDEVLVRAGVETQLDFFLPRDTMAGAPRVVGPVVDPRGWGGAERLDARDLAALPVIDLAEATSLWSDAQSVSYAAGRPGSQQLAIDGTVVRNPYDGSTSPLGLRVPLGMLEEASLATDPWIGPGGLSGLQQLISADGSAQWRGRAGIQTDRPFSGPADIGFDRVSARVDGPVGRGRVVVVLDATGRLQAEPLSAPRGDPRTPAPWTLGHDAGEWIDGAVKVHVPLSARRTLQVLAVRSQEQRSLFDPAFKYDPGPGAGRRITATLLAAELRRASQRVTMFLRARYFARSLTESELAASPTYALGALGGRYDFVGIDLARAQDTAAAAGPIAGFVRPEFTDATPWGVAAFFLRGGSRGSLFWNRYREMGLELALTTAPTQSFKVSGDAGVTVGRVHAFQRVSGSLPVGGSVPPATAASFSPVWLTVGSRAEGRLAGGLLIGSLRLDAVSTGVPGAGGMRASVSPRVGVSVPVGGALFSATAARVSQFPDLQFLSSVAFDDSLAGGHLRRGDPDLGYESLGLVELQFRMRVRQDATLRAVIYKRRFDGLVGSTPAATLDSSAFGNRDRLDVTGGEIMVDKGLGAATRVTASYAAEDASFEAVNGFRVASGVPILKSEVLGRFVLTARGTLPGAVQAGAVVRVRSGTPFTLIPSGRSRTAVTVDALLRRAVRLGRWNARAYVDGRNLLNARYVVAVQPSGKPGLDSASIENMAQGAYAATPGSIPYDSPRYRAFADLDGNGVIEGPGELLPLFRAAAADFGQPLRAYGPLRSVRLGVEIAF